MIAAGIIGGLLAAVFGLVDWWAIPAGTRAKQIGLGHGVGNVVVLLFIASWFSRKPAPSQPSTGALTLSFIAVGVALVTGRLGRELVNRWVWEWTEVRTFTRQVHFRVALPHRHLRLAKYGWILLAAPFLLST
jgi:uncharacterized membrane protein